MKMLFWNVSGVGNPFFLSTFWRIVQQIQLEMCVLMETILPGSSLDCIRHQFPLNWSFYAMETEGLSGGIMVVWKLGAASINVFHQCP